ncbi:MAG: FtsX-like permease family protein [Planctomycetales bacterium]|nr:FtsX-like permease family protein [Planctomycetales bacterium]
MNIFQLAILEILHRKTNFILAVLAIVVAVAYATSSITRMRVTQQRTAQRVAALDDEIRKSMKALGFNLIILPADQNLSQFHANDFAEKTMPYEFVQKIADSKLVSSINHLRPALVAKADWREQKRQVVLMGVSGVVPWTHRSNNKKPLEDPVPQGTINVGHVLAQELALKQGDATKFNGLDVTINKVYPSRGNKDDITVWIDLAAAQQMLNLPDRINLIQALECNCATIDRVAEIQNEISQVLGDEVQVIEIANTAIARAQARNEVAASGKEAVASMQQRSKVELTLISIAGMALVGLIAWLNVRDRRGEIGVLRAVGLTSRKIAGLFLVKAFCVGLVGAVVGYGIGLVATYMSEHQYVAALDMFGVVCLLTPLVALIASWIPATLAAGQDAAVVLAEEL